MKVIGNVKIDKLNFGFRSTNAEATKAVIEVANQYYDKVYYSSEGKSYNHLYLSITPTKQLREPDYSSENNHNLQMVPLKELLKFLKELVKVAGCKVDIYEMHLAKDITTEDVVATYLNTILKHEYTNGYKAFNNEADSSNTVYIGKNVRKLDSKHSPKLLIKFYDKTAEMINHNKANRIPVIKEPLNSENIPTDNVNGRDVILLYKMNLLRAEMELKKENLPYTTIQQMIEAIENNQFQDTLEKTYSTIMLKTVFAQPKEISCKSLKEVAITLSRNSKIDYELLFYNQGMDREYRYYKRAKEVKNREDDFVFDELKSKLL